MDLLSLHGMAKLAFRVITPHNKSKRLISRSQTADSTQKLISLPSAIRAEMAMACLSANSTRLMRSQVIRKCSRK